jgi:hypothetical protein
MDIETIHVSVGSPFGDLAVQDFERFGKLPLLTQLESE